jgi:transcriptional regulator of aromatic amino acid metabolism
MTTAIEKAERDLNNLEEQREALFSRAKLLSRTREQVAHAALVAGDKKAKEKLAEINAEDTGLAAHVASVDAALVVARANLAAAQLVEAGAADHEKAKQIAELNGKLKEQLDDANDAFADAIESVLSARALLMEMHGLGVTSPTDQLFRINAVAAIKTAIQKLPEPWIRDFEFSRLAPSQKKEFKPLAATWHAGIENQIAHRLPKKEAA